MYEILSESIAAQILSFGGFYLSVRLARSWVLHAYVILNLEGRMDCNGDMRIPYVSLMASQTSALRVVERSAS
jgi:hypothetical protein